MSSSRICPACKKPIRPLQAVAWQDDKAPSTGFKKIPKTVDLYHLACFEVRA